MQRRSQDSSRPLSCSRGGKDGKGGASVSSPGPHSNGASRQALLSYICMPLTGRQSRGNPLPWRASRRLLLHARCCCCQGQPRCRAAAAAAVPPGCQLSRPCTVALPRTQCRRSLRGPRLLGSGHSRPGGQPQYPACSLHAYPLRKLYRTPGPPGTAKGWAATWPGLRTSLKPAATFRTQRGLGDMHDIVAWSRRRRRRKNGMFCGGHRPAGAARLVVCGYCLTHAFEMYSSSS